MNRLELDQQLGRLSVLMPPAKDAEDVERRRVFGEEIWRKFQSIDAATWALVVGQVIDSHGRSGPPRPSDFTDALQFVRERALKSPGSNYTPPTPEEAEAWELEEVRRMKPAWARWVLARVDADKRLQLPGSVVEALLVKAGEDAGPTPPAGPLGEALDSVQVAEPEAVTLNEDEIPF